MEISAKEQQIRKNKKQMAKLFPINLNCSPTKLNKYKETKKQKHNLKLYNKVKIL